MNHRFFFLNFWWRLNEEKFLLEVRKWRVWRHSSDGAVSGSVSNEANFLSGIIKSSSGISSFSSIRLNFSTNRTLYRVPNKYHKSYGRSKIIAKTHLLASTSLKISFHIVIFKSVTDRLNTSERSFLTSDILTYILSAFYLVWNTLPCEVSSCLDGLRDQGQSKPDSGCDKCALKSRLQRWQYCKIYLTNNVP